MNIRPAITTDIALLQAIGKQTFYETFADTNTPEDMEQYLTTSFATSKVQQELSNPDSLFFFCKVAFGIKTDLNFRLFLSPKSKECLIFGLVFSDKIHVLLTIVGTKIINNRQMYKCFKSFFYHR